MSDVYYNYQMNGWSFVPDEAARLIWVSSPFLDAAKGKRLYAAFQSQSKLDVMNLRLGELPILLLGHRYLGGQLLKECCPGEKVVFRRDEVLLKGYKSLSVCLPTLFSRIDSGSRQFDKDLCAVIEVRGTTYIIPCMEIIRATAGTASFLIYTLFSGLGLADFSYGQIDGNTLHLTLNEEKPNQYPKNAIRNAAIRDYVNFILCVELSDWWEGVRTRYLAASTYNGTIPVEAFFPDAPDMEIVGYRAPDSDMLWGIELNNLPDSKRKIIVYHSSFLNTKSGDEDGKGVIRSSTPENESVIIDADETASSSHNNIVLSVNPGRYRGNANISRAKHGEKRARSSIAVHPLWGSALGSMGDPLPGGTLPQYEVMTEEQEELDLPQNIVHIYNALKRLADEGEVNSLSIRSNQFETLQYAVMSGTISFVPFTILEFEQTDDYSLSTLLVRKSADSAQIERSAATLLKENYFQWNRDAVEAAIPGAYLLRHSEGRSIETEARLISAHLRR